MKNLFFTIFLLASGASLAQNIINSNLKLTSSEEIASKYFHDVILPKDFPNIKMFLLYNKVESDKIYTYTICNPENTTKTLTVSMPYDFTEKGSNMMPFTGARKAGEFFVKEKENVGNNSFVILYFKNKDSKYIYSFIVDTNKNNVLSYCKSDIVKTGMVQNDNYEKQFKDERVSERKAGLYRDLRDKEPYKSGVGIVMKEVKKGGETFYKCTNCDELFGSDYARANSVSDGSNYYFRKNEIFLDKFYSKVEFIGDYMYYLTLTYSYNGPKAGSSLTTSQNISKYVNYDGVHINNILTKESLTKIIEDDIQLLEKFKNQSRKNKYLKQYLIEYYDRKK